MPKKKKSCRDLKKMEVSSKFLMQDNEGMSFYASTPFHPAPSLPQHTTKSSSLPQCHNIYSFRLQTTYDFLVLTVRSSYDQFDFNSPRDLAIIFPQVYKVKINRVCRVTDCCIFFSFLTTLIKRQNLFLVHRPYKTRMSLKIKI